MELFDEQICEVRHEDRRLILRRNPVRAEELAASRRSKRACVEALCDKENLYLGGTPEGDNGNCS